MNPINTIKEEQYWSTRYAENKTGWDIGYPSTPIIEYIDQLENRDIKILIPGAGNSYEAEYLWAQGFKNISILDISEKPLQHFLGRVPDFPVGQVIHGDFFVHDGTYDLILEQTFFCSFVPTKEVRSAYAKKMKELLVEGGKLVGLWFDIKLDPAGNRPFGGDRELYLQYFDSYFDVKTFEPCYNSIMPRQGSELFGIFVK